MADDSSTGGMGSSGGTALGAIAGGIIGMGQGAINTNQNKKAQRRSYEMQRKLNEQGAELGLQMWKDTNYSAQIRELEKAGLSTGLIYGQGGAGGATTNAGSGGSAPSQAPANFELGMAMQGAQQMAQLELMKAQTNKTNAEAENIAGVEKENTIADTALKTMQTENQKLLNGITSETKEDVVATVKANYNKAEGEAAKAVAQGRYAEGTAKAESEKLQQEALNTIFQGEAIKAGTKLTQEQTRKIGEELAQGWEDLYQKARANDNQAGMVNIAGFNAKLNEILGKANIDIRQKELMIRGAEAFVNGIGGLKGKTTTTNSHTSSPTGETYHSSQTTTR